MSDELVDVCMVGHQVYRGPPMERDAAALSKGDVILVDGKPETVKRVWFYDGIVVDLESGKALHPQFGDTFTKPPLGENGGL